MNGYSTNCPCNGCTDRHFKCWGECQKYQEWRKARDERINRSYEAKQKASVIDNFFTDRTKRRK